MMIFYPCSQHSVLLFPEFALCRFVLQLGDFLFYPFSREFNIFFYNSSLKSVLFIFKFGLFPNMENNRSIIAALCSSTLTSPTERWVLY